jgi:hypothetical protein
MRQKPHNNLLKVKEWQHHCTKEKEETLTYTPTYVPERGGIYKNEKRTKRKCIQTLR